MFSTVACTLLIAGASGFHLSAPVSQRSAAAARASALCMGEEPVVKYGEGSGWCADCRMPSVPCTDDTTALPHFAAGCQQ